MSIICFSSLKGGVGKTSLSINVSHAFAERGCQTLLIDLDPVGHATRFFTPNVPFGRDGADEPRAESPLARLFLDRTLSVNGRGSLLHAAEQTNLSLVVPVRRRFDVLPTCPALRHFFWGKGAQSFREFFPRLIEELKDHYDHIVIDTSPDLNVITRNSIALADIVAVPVDSSEMSIHCLEEVIAQTSHIKGATWSIVRTMVNKQASRVQEFVDTRIRRTLSLEKFENRPTAGENSEFNGNSDGLDFEDASQFLWFLRKREQELSKQNGTYRPQTPADPQPIYLLNSIVYRTEDQNKLSFVGRTAFDGRTTWKLADQYLHVARELENIIALRAHAPREDEDLGEDLGYVQRLTAV